MTILKSRPGHSGGSRDALPLETGDHLDRATFHERYKATPEHVRAQLIEGIVYMSSPAYRRHGASTAIVVGWLVAYAAATPGLEVLDNTTVILGDDAEPQPDACLLIRAEHGGHTRVDEEDIVVGPPELIVEVASSSASIDLHAKKRDYEKAGVLEYVVPLVRQGRIVWFGRRDGGFQELQPGEDGPFRSEVFPGLWLEPTALLNGDVTALLDVLQRGLQTAEHAAFVRRLRAKP